MKNLFLGLIVLSTYGSTLAQAAIQINGAGATFPYPIYSKWFSEYKKINPEVQINYQSIGSGGGIRQFQQGTVDFGATDAPMTDEQISKSGKPVIHIPTVLGAVVMTYNLPGIADLKLSSEVIADIFLGKIKKWNDPKIVADNSKLNLPDMPIIVAHRSDGSGTTGIFTDYLSKISAEWKSKVGAGNAVNWPTGLGGKGNEGVTGIVKQSKGALGYVELIYAESNKLSYAKIRNKAGNFISPEIKSVTSAAAGSEKSMPEDFRISITNADGKDAYPISGFTYLLVSQPLPKEKGGALLGFLKWAMKDGQKIASSLFYAPLPASLIKKVEAKISTLKTE